MNCNNLTCPKRTECKRFNPRANMQRTWIIENKEFKCDGFISFNTPNDTVNDLFNMFGMKK